MIKVVDDDVDTAGGWEVRVCRLVLDLDCCGEQQNILRTKSALTVVIAASCTHKDIISSYM